MRKMLPLCIVGILVLSGLGAVAASGLEETKSISESVSFSQPILTEKENYIAVELPEATSYLMETGKPSLPITTKQYVFPFGTQITDVNVFYDTTNEQLLSKPVMLAPEPQIVSTTLKLSTAKEIQEIHSIPNIISYPASSYSYRVGTGLQDGEHVVFLSVHLYPVRYKQSINTICYSEGATIDVSYTSPENPVNFGDSYTLLVITPAQFTTQLQPLVDYKNDNGVPTTMVTLEDIPTVGVDRQEDIKYYIKNAIETLGISNVLLVGSGVRDQELLPVRYAWIPSDVYENDYPSDLYYADIYNSIGGFSSWDFDGDGKYCEFPGDVLAVDLYPDVYLGRLPCNTADEVTTIVNKIIDFKEHNKVLNKIIQIGGDTFTGDDEGIYEGEYANTQVLAKLPGYTSTKLWASLGTLTKSSIIMNINKNVDFVDCSGHGSWASWATHPPNDENTWIPTKTLYSPYNGFMYYDAQFLFNSKKLPVFVFNACSTSKYSESENCLSWKVLSRSGGGGIASFGASGIGYGSYGTHETERLWGWMEVHIFQELYNTKVLGQVWANALNGYIDSFFLEDADYKTITEMAMFGDPTLAIQDGNNPQSNDYVQGIQQSTQPSVQQSLQQLSQQQSIMASRILLLKQMQGQQLQN
jgi:hypothetical protein